MENNITMKELTQKDVDERLMGFITLPPEKVTKEVKKSYKELEPQYKADIKITKDTCPVAKEMVYHWNRIFKPLATGECNGFFWAIVSYGTHPCAYVGVTKEHPLWGMNYNDFYIKVPRCREGINYSRFSKHFPDDNWIFGWSYADSYSFDGMDMLIRLLCEKDKQEPDFSKFPAYGMGKRWTVNEMKRDVISVCKRLKAFQDHYRNTPMPTRYTLVEK